MRSFDLKFESSIFYGLGCIISKRADDGPVLFVPRQIVKQTFYSTWRKKTNDFIFIFQQQLFYVVALSAIHKTKGKLAAICLKPVHDLIILLVLRAYVDKFFIAFVFVDGIKKTLVGAVTTIKNFSLAVKNKFLQVQSHCLCDTEIFGILRHIHFHLFAHTKEMINRIATGEYYTRVILNFNFLFTEVSGRNRLKTNEWLEFQLNIVPSCQFKIRRLISLGPRLCNQNLFHIFGRHVGLNPVF